MLRTIVVCLLAGCAVRGQAEVRELPLDPMATVDRWQLGGRRVNYTLGASSLAASAEQTHGAAAALRLTCDFADPNRDYLSAYHVGEAIPGRCEEASFQLHGDAPGCRLRLSLEDARGRWFERDLGTVDWRGWRQVRVAIGDGEGWAPLLRIGEEKLPVLHPVNLRQIALFRGPTTPAKVVVYLQDLRARSDVAPADFVSARLSTGRAANLFDVGEPATVRIGLANAGQETVAGRLAATVTDFFGEADHVDLGEVALPAGATAARELRYRTERLGTYEAKVTLQSGGRERQWFARFAVIRPLAPRPPDPRSLFGCQFTLAGFSGQDLPTVLRLDRDAGIRWERIGFDWGEINPAPGVWAWDGPPRAEGPSGKAVELQGQALSLPHSPALDCPGAVSIAFWARGTAANGTWQTPLHKWGSGNRRNYGVYFHLQTGEFYFSGSFAKRPDSPWCDFGSGCSAWDRQWHHYAATYSEEAKKVALYVDGRLRAAHDFDGGELRTNSEPLVLGAGYPGGLDELLLYRRALSAEEVAALAQKGRPPPEGLVGWWPFEETGASLKDRSPNHLDFGGAAPSGPRLARLALDHGIKTLGLLGFPPTWASTAPAGAERPYCYAPEPRAWAAFVENTTRRYRDLVQHWEIWNEPNITVFWLPQPDAKQYLETLKVAYAAAKRGNPQCSVIMPGLAGPSDGGWGMDFLEELLKLGAARYCDAISVHPYRQATPEESDLAGDLRRLAGLAEKNGGRRRFWFTEDCWTTQIQGGSTERRQALMLPRCYALSLGTGLMERFLWFRLHDPGVDRFYSEDNYGMCHYDLTPKPAYFAHRTVATLLDRATPDGEWDVGPRALARCFRTEKERLAAVWSPQGRAPASLFIGAPTVRVVDLMGNESSVATLQGVLLLEADEAAVFLRGLPDRAEGRGTVLAGSATATARGQQGRLTVRVHNPFPKPQRARVTLAARPPLSLSSTGAEVEIPANAAREVEFPFATSPDAEAGRHALAATLEFAGHAYSQELPVSVRSAPPDAGPVGYWKLDEGEGATIRDSSPCGNHGTVDHPRWVDGKHGKALQFDGTRIAVIPDSPSLNLRDEVTLAFQLKLLGETGTWQFPVTKYFQENIRRNYGIYLSRDKLCPCFSASFERGSYLHSDIGSAVPVNDGRWHHLAATCSMFDRRVRLYVDGQLVADRAFDEGAMLLTTDPVRLGGGTIGVLDEVRIYPRALSPQEVAALVEE